MERIFGHDLLTKVGGTTITVIESHAEKVTHSQELERSGRGTAGRGRAGRGRGRGGMGC
jgi:hypothetical protein